MISFIQYILGGMSIGATYSIVGLGYYIMWAACRAVNFSHGNMLMLGAVLAVSALDSNVPLWIGIPGAIVICGAAGGLLEKVAVRPFNKDSSATGWMLTTIAAGIMLESIATLKFGSLSRSLPSPGIAHAISVGGAGVYPQELAIPVCAIAIVLLLEWFYRRTVLGRAMRAVSFNRTAAGLMGINVNRIAMIAFMLAAALGGAAGILIGPITQVSPSMGMTLGLKGFAVAIVAGIGSGFGVVATGIAYGILEKITEGYIGTAAREAIGFSVMIVLLLFFPQGLFGKKETNKV